MGTGSYTTEGTTAMAEMLKVNFSLRSLLLSDNSMKSEGAVLLAEALRTNSSLTKLKYAASHCSGFYCQCTP